MIKAPVVLMLGSTIGNCDSKSKNSQFHVIPQILWGSR